MTLKGRCFLNSCILANNIETVTDFISLIFDETSAEILINPVKHAIIKLDENSQLLLIQKSTCSKQQLKFLLATSVTHVTSYSKNVMGIQRNAIVAGAKIITKCTDDNPAYCVIQGPENIVFIVSLHENSEQKSWFYDYILENLPALGTGISSPIPNFVAASRKGLGLIRLGSTRNPEVRARSLSPAAVRSSGDKNNKTIAQSVKLQLTDANALKPGDAKNKGSDKTNTSILNVLNSSSVTAINGDTTGSNSNPPNLASLPIFGPPLTTVESAVYLTGHDHVVFPPNSQDPIAFETDFFKGQMMLVVRTEPIIPEFKQFFAGKRRRMEIQIQGQFKRLPQGEIYMGAYVSNKMELGLITRSIAKAALSYVGSRVTNMHYSFGDSDPNDPAFQLPHCVSPMFVTFDKIIVTPPGETPPKIRDPYDEDPEYRKMRLNWHRIKDANIQLDNIYSFSSNTQNIDLVTWTLTNFPMIRALDIRTLAGESSLFLAAYELPTAAAQAFPNSHPQKDLNYVFSMRLNPVSADKMIDLTSEGKEVKARPIELDDDLADGEEDNDEDRDGDQTSKHHGDLANMNAMSRESRIVSDDEGDEYEMVNEAGDDDDDEEDDEVDSKKLLTISQDTVQKSKSRRFKATSGDKGPVTVGGWIRRRIDDITPDALDIPETSEYVPVNYEQESLGELRFCPMSIEVNDQRILKNRRRRTVYLLPWLETFPQSTQNSTMSSLLAASAVDILDEKTRNKLSFRFRPYSEISKVFPMLAIPRLHKNKKLSAEERKRRQIVESYKNLVQKNGTPTQFMNVESFMNPPSALDQGLLENSFAPSLVSRSRSKIVAPNLSREVSVTAMMAGVETPNTGAVDFSLKYEGTVCMAISSRHWSENVLRITKSGIAILPNSESVRAYTNISVKSIFCIRQMKREETPIFFLKSLAFFQIETFARVYYFMVKEKYVTAWMQFFQVMYGSAIVKLPSDPIGKVLYTFPEPAEAYIARPTCWKLDKKRIFNYRRIIFSPKCIPIKYQSSSPNEIIEDILASAFALSAAESTSSAEASDWVKFLDDITVVQTLNFSKLNEKDKIAFLLNIYHLMVVHASLILGPPLSWASWQGFFNSSYLLAFDIISISEVEYNLLRASMSAPSPILSKLAVPHSHYPGLALTQKDFRLNFCINCGTQSSPAVVPIYRVSTLDSQMDEYTSRMVSEFVKVDQVKRIVSMPKMCSIFLNDFVSRKISTPQSMDCLRALIPYLRSDDRNAVIRMMNEQTFHPATHTIIIKFQNFDFRCRSLTLYDERKLPLPYTSSGKITK